MERNLTCIVCPLGCNIKVDFDGKTVKSIEGNTCPRGAGYAESECINPTRTVTTTVLCSNGEVLPVKTNNPIPKNMIFECMKAINNCKIILPIRVGDVIIKNVLNTGADVVATANKSV